MSHHRRISVPAGAIAVTRFERFRHLVQQFVAGRFHLLMLLGPPGVAKSQTVQRAIDNRSHLYLANQLATPKQIAYLQALGVDVPENLSKQEASALLDQALAGNTGHVPVIRVTRRVPGATPKRTTDTAVGKRQFARSSPRVPQGHRAREMSARWRRGFGGSGDRTVKMAAMPGLLRAAGVTTREPPC